MDRRSGTKRKYSERNNNSNSSSNSTNNDPPPPPKRPRNPAALVRSNAISFRPIPNQRAFNSNNDSNNNANTNSAPAPVAPAPRPPLVSAMKGTRPKNTTRRISHTNAPPSVRVFYPPGPGITPGTFNPLEENTSEPRYHMAHQPSQTNRYFERYILPCLYNKLPKEDIEAIYAFYIEYKTTQRTKSPNTPFTTKSNAHSAYIRGVISKYFKNINAENINRNSIRSIPDEYVDLPMYERVRIFDDVMKDLLNAYSERESISEYVPRLRKLLDVFSPFLDPEYVTQANKYFTTKLENATRGGRSSRRSHRSRRHRNRKN